jgi:glycosyltransferase involved in cell wall biosynthesis
MISVVMATLDGLRYLPVQLESVLRQLGPEDELVVSDNGSTDGTLAFLEKAAAKDKRMLLLVFGSRRGVVANYENALRHAHGDVLLLCDQDDIWLPGRVDFFRTWFVEHPRTLLLQTDAELVDAEGRRTDESFFYLRRSGPGLMKNFVKNGFQGCSLGFRRTLLDVALPFPTRLPMHDMWLGLLAEAAGTLRTAFSPKVLTRHRRHGGNSSSLEHAAWSRVVIWRFRLFGSLLSRWPRVRRAFRGT